MKIQKILTIGSLTSDMFLHPRRQEVFQKNNDEYIGFCLGDKIRVQERNETFGGGGANVAVGLSRFGHKTSVLGRVGSDMLSDKILTNLKNEQVSVDCVQQGDGGSGFSLIFSVPSGERTVLFASGANDDFCFFDAPLLHHFDAICLQHLSGCSAHVFEQVCDFFLQYPEKFLSWNPGRESLEQGAEHFRGLLSAVDVLMLNMEEAEVFTSKNNLQEIYALLFQYVQQGNIIITHGMRGATASDGKNMYSCSVLPGIERKDTLGAGDSFLSGLVGGILSGKSLPESMKLGTINAAHVVKYFGAQQGLQSCADLEKHISQIDISSQSFSLSSHKKHGND